MKVKVKLKSLLINIAKCIKYSGDYNQLIATIGDRGNAFVIENNGELNKDKTIFLIEYSVPNVGFFGIYRQILDLIYVGDKLKLPLSIVINHSLYNKDMDDERDNVFEYFFIQPDNIGYDEAHNSYSIIRADSRNTRCIKYFLNLRETNDYEVCQNKEYLTTLVGLKRKYIRYNETTRIRLEEQKQIFRGLSKILGIHFRGTDFNFPLKNHPIPLKIEDFFGDIDRISSSNYDAIFVATDDEDALKKIKDRYEDRLKIIYIKETHRSGDGVPVHLRAVKTGDESMEKGFEVLLDMYMLSCCDSIVSGLSQVSLFARIEKMARDELYEEDMIITKGCYQYSDKKKRKQFFNNNDVVEHFKNSKY